MKARKVIVAVAVSAAAACGGIYGAYTYASSQKKPVQVVAVSSINQGYWGNDTSTTTGEIVSRNSQSVDLSSDYTLTKVYVKEGDSVKVGDPLLEYDMTLVELQKEMEQLNLQLLNIKIDSSKRTLAKLNGGTLPADFMETETGSAQTALVETGTEIRTTSADVILPEDAAVPEDTAAADGISSGDSSSDQLLSDGGEEQPQDSAAQTPDTGQNAETDTSSGQSDDLIEDEGNVVTDGSATPETAESSETSADILSDIQTFFNTVSLLREMDLTNLKEDYITGALSVFENRLSSSVDVTIENDLLHENRTVKKYQLSEKVKDSGLIDADTEKYLYEGYAWALMYRFLYSEQQLEKMIPEGRQVADLDNAGVKALESQLRNELDAYYQLICNTGWDENTDLGSFVKTLKETYLYPYTGSSSILANLAARLNSMEIVEPETETESESEMPSETGGYNGDYGGAESGTEMTAQERAEAIREAEDEIKDLNLDIRESNLKIKQYDRELDGQIVKASVNGIVKSAGTIDGGGTDDSFIVIAGAAGMYARGTLSELSLDTVKIGDTITGMSYDTGMSFEATVTEISPYPDESGSNYYYSDDSANASYYPFYAYIENTDGITEGFCDLYLQQNNGQSGIFLDNYFIRTDASGRDYVYIQGADGLLKKQYIKTDISQWGSNTEVTAGLTENDLIAFPYGKNVAEGAKTQTVDVLDALSSYY